ncbi:DNA mismatch repair protein MutL, partial [Yoonia sp. R2-816]
NLQIQFHGEYPHALPSNERAKVADFYAARDNTTPPLPWPSIAPPITAARGAAYQAQTPAFEELANDLSGNTPELSVPEGSSSSEPTPTQKAETPAESLPLGAARGQVHENYIIAQTSDGMVIVDQHAAHERLVYERLKHQMAKDGIPAQALLIPEIVELPEEDCSRLMELAEELSGMGLTIEPFGGNAIAVRE